MAKHRQKISFHPGEFEVLTTKACREWWQGGKIIMTNHRLLWFPSGSASAQSAPTIEIDLQKVLGCTEVRSWFYLLAKPALRILLTTGKSIDFHDIKDYGGVKSNVERFMGQERYTPGSLFSNP
jgi:hypothetical protein